MKYLKFVYIENYETCCRIPNCYVCSDTWFILFFPFTPFVFISEWNAELPLLEVIRTYLFVFTHPHPLHWSYSTVHMCLVLVQFFCACTMYMLHDIRKYYVIMLFFFYDPSKFESCWHHIYWKSTTWLIHAVFFCVACLAWLYEFCPIYNK